MSSDPPPKGAMRQHVTPLLSIEQQVGAHVVHALQQENVVAVLSAVAPGAHGGQCIVSVGLNPDHLEQVQALLAEPHELEEPRVPCIGFHCFLPEKGKESR